MMPVEQWFEQCAATRLLVENLEVTLEAMADNLSEDNRKAITRLNLIVIRQCMLDCGVDFKNPARIKERSKG